jgi:1,4-dihydroxy-6-naphthoate synthase
MLSLAISPCPNDTFVFCEMAPRYRLALDDVEALNSRAERGEFDVTKISVAAYGRIRDRYALLRAGGAAGFGVGPLLVAARPRSPGGRIACPAIARPPRCCCACSARSTRFRCDSISSRTPCSAARSSAA